MDEQVNKNPETENQISQISLDGENVNSNENPRKSKKGIWAALGALGVLLLKFKAVLFLVLGKLKFLFILLKLGKFFSTFGSMLFMIFIYAQIYGWPYGIGFVLLIFVHEAGHYLTAKNVNMDVSTPIFIPFVGAFINMKEHPADAVTEAKVALGGPVLGSAGALACVVFYSLTGSHLFLALAYTGFMLNLFNMIPVHPLDGGRIVSAISPKIWLIGIPVMLFVAVKFFNPIVILFLILGCVQAYKYWKNPNEGYYDTPTKTRTAFAAVYFGLIILLGFGMFLIHDAHAFIRTK